MSQTYQILAHLYHHMYPSLLFSLSLCLKKKKVSCAPNVFLSFHLWTIFLPLQIHQKLSSKYPWILWTSSHQYQSQANMSYLPYALYNQLTPTLPFFLTRICPCPPPLCLLLLRILYWLCLTLGIKAKISRHNFQSDFSLFTPQSWFYL